MTFKNIAISISWCFFMLLSGVAWSFPPVNYLGIDQGLSNNSVRCIYQDHKGFMWFGTFDGLNRYDGYSFRIFRNKLGDTTSLNNNYIFAIDEDDNANMWVGTQGGVNVYNNLSGTFSPVYIKPFGTNHKQKITIGVRAIKNDGGGNIFLGTLGMGLLLSRGDASMAVQVPLLVGNKNIRDYDVQVIRKDHSGRLLVFVPQYGLCVLDRTSMKLNILSAEIKHAFSIEPDGDRVWLGTANGLYVYDAKANTVEKKAGSGANGLTGDAVTGMVIDNNKELWLAINGYGVNIYNTGSGKIDYLRGQNGKSPLSSDAAYVVFKDKEARIWIGTLNGGINVVDPQKYKFNTIANDPANPNSLPINYISNFYEASDQNIWVGTDGGGLAIWNRETNHFKQYKNTAAPNSLTSNVVDLILHDSRNDTWLATFGGVNKYDKVTDGFIHYKCINPLTGLENRSVSTICEDQHQDIWVGTLKGGGSNGALYLLDRKTQKFNAFDTNLSDICVFNPDQEGRLWAGMLTQLVNIDRINKKHQFFEMGNYVRSIYEDHKHNFWVGTEGGGLILFNRETNKIIAQYTTDQGLCNNSVLTILEDNEGNLWLSTFNGLSKFNPQTKIFKNFYKSDGLQSNQFHYNAGYKLKSGELLFGGINGFNMFLPKNIQSVSHLPTLVLSGLLVNNVQLANNSPFIKRKTSDMIQNIEVPYSQAIFSFEFTALEYTAPDKIKYAYIMDGWDHKWNYSGNIRSATYTHIDEGNYIFRVKCTNSEGFWVDKEIQLRIHVLPPWYRAWWAILFYIVALGSVTGIYFLYKNRQTRLKYEVSIATINIEKEKAERGKERAEKEKIGAMLNLERAEHEKERIINEKEKEVNDKRLSFFTNISHEFRTPLTLILNPAKSLLEKKDMNPVATHEVNVIYRNARRMLSLVDQLLHFRKVDSKAEQIFPVLLNLPDLCYEVYQCFTQQAASLHIKYDFICNDPAIEIYADRSKLEIILYNLLSNAIKYTPEQGHISFSISEESDCITVEISDTGYGIKNEEGERIFEKFYQAEDSSGSVKPGFGIGLYLVKHFVEAHHGRIRYLSKLGAGTTFALSLMKGKDHFAGLIIDDPASVLYDNMPGNKNAALLYSDLAVNDQLDEDDVPENPFEGELFTERKSMLITDDDDEIRTYIAELFTKDFNIYEASSGEEGLSIATQYLPDIIISDIKMQGISGIDFCQAVKKEEATAHIPVILLTGTSSPQLRLEGVERGADDYIIKPFEKEYLIARVTGLLKTRNNLQNYFYNRITHKNSDAVKVSAEYKEFIEKCIAIVEQYIDDSEFNVTTLLKEIGMSHSNLYRKVKSVSGVSVTVFIRLIRLRKAAELMLKYNYNVNEISAMVGFNSPNYFRTQFSKLFGMKPSAYIKNYRTSFSDEYAMNNSNFQRHKNK
jgi:signal transduction histidine kinase/ligand-binding sensor domain-containing protein/DNA-binding response OmpR family regulator